MIVYGDEARKLAEGIDAVADAVKEQKEATRTFVLENRGSPTIINDEEQLRKISNSRMPSQT